VLGAVRRVIAAFSAGRSPVAMAARVHELVRAVSGVRDPYLAVKRDSNRACREAMPILSQTVAWSVSRFETAVKLAIAGSTIDSGPSAVRSLTKRDAIRKAQDAIAEPLAGESIIDLEQVVHDAANVLFIGDNAGECFLDTFLLDLIPSARLTYAVRGSPVLNDATLEDARAAGIDRRCRVVDTGDNAPGVLLERCSSGFRDAFERADLLILKGQGNYESLRDVRGKTCVFLTRVKCEVLARDMGHPVGANVIRIQNDARPLGGMLRRSAAREEVSHA
jgi:uncharacterized protein with ATP-grasp and redox domains